MKHSEEQSRIRERIEEIDGELCKPETLRNPSLIKQLNMERSGLVRIDETLTDIMDTRTLLYEMSEAAQGDDQELSEMAQVEIPGLEERLEKLGRKLKILLIPPDPNDRRGAVMEIRAGTGGEEAALFAGDIYRMYSSYAQKMGWKLETMSVRESERGGLKEIIFNLSGDGVYSRLKYESGVHRVQRVPETETSGRIHTSACTVAVLPEAEEVDIDINPEDLRIDVYRSSGPGGQSVNTTDSAVRITHIPTGTVVSCQDEKSQHKNKAKAMKVLRSRLLVVKQEEEEAKRSESRRSMVGSGDRSAKIRTYNFPQGRFTDHRIHLTLHALDSILGGDLDPVIEELIKVDQERILSERSEG
ncbi:MAG TPA: peptide chain release factor 1 [Candidatus Sabulitectum sp.]|nr:peptide chain release factor 1 [Candidatus Sabulitectum sp.]HPF31383.1 peptide chain release factor 1 [Candidatus Sabulitectum sp.]HPJ27443.1 peptide chain release factor 1 [Candidatus Sabulitectum sp.]HPR21332.1 peptide chain release factor 1 [Candidatus Sabulitectum sp.]